MGFIAGAYAVTAGGASLGQIEDGIETDFIPMGEPIKGDNMGDTTQDGVCRGGDMFASMTLLEYNAVGALSVFWPWSATFGKVGIVGRLWSSLAIALVLTARSGTSASTVPATLTAYALLAEGQSLRFIFAPRLRRVPLRFRLLPQSGGPDPADATYFVTT